MKRTHPGTAAVASLMLTLPMGWFPAGSATGASGAHSEPFGRTTIMLNSSEGHQWTLWYGVQDKHAPVTPEGLVRSGFSMLNATVPGNVEMDLERHGVIADPSVGTNVYALRKYKAYQWWYHLTFAKPAIPEGHSAGICFDGIDCISEIWLNGQRIASTDNMLVEHRFDVGELLQAENQLYVCIKSAELESRKRLRNNFGIRYDINGPAANLRKAPHMFGWDIMPRLLSAGI